MPEDEKEPGEAVFTDGRERPDYGCACGFRTNDMEELFEHAEDCPRANEPVHEGDEPERYP